MQAVSEKYSGTSAKQLRRIFFPEKLSDFLGRGLFSVCGVWAAAAAAAGRGEGAESLPGAAALPLPV